MGETLFLEMLGIGLTCAIFDFVAEPIEVVMEEIRRVGETTILIILVDIAKDIHNRGILAAIVGEHIRVI